MSKTNQTTNLILKDLFNRGIFAWRNSVGALRTDHGYYQMGKTGSSDIIAILPSHGQFLGIEIKTGRDCLRPAQLGFKANIEKMGAVYIVVKDFNDYLDRIRSIR